MIVDPWGEILAEIDGDGPGVLFADIDEYVKGANARLKATKATDAPFTRADIYSVNALAGQIFGQGGGDEVRRSQLLSGLQSRLGVAQGNQVFDDLSEHMDADTPVTTSTNFPYEAIPTSRAGNALVDPGSNARSVTATRGADTPHASNFLMVAANRSSTGHPIFVGGPQIGYFYPGLTFEEDLEAPGIQARGAAIPAGVGNILIGRNQDSAWTLTSAGSDTNDQFIETLCGGSDHRYVFNGVCRPMQRIDAGTIEGKPVVFYRTIHGPVQGYATSKGKRIAISFKRSSYAKDMYWQVMFKRLTDGKVKDVKSFYDAAALNAFTFNTAYVDDKHIAFYSAGLLPIRAKDVDPRLPTIGDGKHEWQGFLSKNAHVHAADPADGELTNWNNKPGAGFGSSDSQWSYGSAYRVTELRAGLAKRQVHDPASVVSAMNAAATMDFRDVNTTLPALETILATGPAPSAREQRMLDLLQAWRETGGSRLDRDGDGKADAGGAPAIMDAVFPRLVDAVLQPALGPQLPELRAIIGTGNAGTKSDFTGNGINYVDKALRQAAGERLASPFQSVLCGGGDLAACRDSLWAAFVAAGDEMAAAQGTNDPNAWITNTDAERITFAPGLLQTTIRYTNRPSGIQQVLSFTGHRP